jgi:hypothetical protein
MDEPILSDEIITRMCYEAYKDPTKKDTHGPFFYRTLLKNLILARMESKDLSARIALSPFGRN